MQICGLELQRFTYGVHFVTEDELQLFGDVSGRKCLNFVVEVDIL